MAAKRKETKPKQKVGGDSTYNLELCKEVCSRVAQGESVIAVLKSDLKYPTFQTWCNWKRENIELFELYTRAREDKAEFIEQQIDETLQAVREGRIDPQTARVILDTHKWRASKWYPKMYGDKTDITSGGEKIKTEGAVINIIAPDAPNVKQNGKRK